MSFEFTKENIDNYLKELAKEYRKQVGKGTPAELILIGGASVLVNYGFRNMTTDIDALFRGASAMKDAVSQVGDRFGLPAGWLNEDFTHTDSYTPRLIEFSTYYRTYANMLTIRTVSAEYLIAMKLKSGRQYKSDLSDVLGILAEHQRQGTPLSMERIQKAVADLYGDFAALPEPSRRFIINVMENGDFETLYAQIIRGEQETKDLLLEFEKNYPQTIRPENVDTIAENLQQKTDRASVMAMLRKRQVDSAAQNHNNHVVHRDDFER